MWFGVIKAPAEAFENGTNGRAEKLFLLPAAAGSDDDECASTTRRA
jgi:hypothetical protein